MFSKVTTPTGAQVTIVFTHTHSLSESLHDKEPPYTQLTLAVVPDRLDFPSSHALIIMSIDSEIVKGAQLSYKTYKLQHSLSIITIK